MQCETDLTQPNLIGPLYDECTYSIEILSDRKLDFDAGATNICIIAGLYLIFVK